MKEIMDFKNSVSILGQNHQDILKETKLLYDTLTNLRYEGKVNSGKNVREMKKILGFFSEKLIPHMKLEDIIFSYLQTHIPKIESVIRVLEAEHKEIKVNLEVLEFLIHELEEEKSESKRTQTIEKLKDKGTYFIYLLEHHIQVEDESIFGTIDQELHIDEAKELLKKIKECHEWRFLVDGY